jgi:electron transfer flavoprotein beta subunit
MTIGPKANADVLKSALALGADRGIHIMTDMSTDQELQPLAVAKIFKKIIEDHEFDLTLMGK